METPNQRAREAEKRTANLRMLRSYITDQRGRKFYYEYAAPSIETVVEDSRKAGLAPTLPSVTQLLEPDMFG